MMRFIQILLLIIVVCPPIFADTHYSLSRQKVARGEPLYAIVEFDGNPDIKTSKRIFSRDGVTAEYIGIEQKITSVNFKVSRKKIVKFRIITAKKGDLQTPELTLQVDGNTVHLKPLPFQVSNKKYTRPPRPRSIFDRLFSHDPFEERDYIDPAENDILIFFATARDHVYIGEPIVGFFKLYYKNMEKPYFERNQEKALEFPFFTTELLENIKITLPDTVIHNQIEYRVIPYQKEVYAITPLKPGVFTLGKSFFSVEGKTTSYFPPLTRKTISKKIHVLPLPQPKPKNFSGEVGNYQIFPSLDRSQTTRDQPVQLTIAITGEGSGLLFKDPMQNVCQQNCPYEISFLGSKKSRKFQKLKQGNYGFEADLVFEYSLLAKKTGIIEPGQIAIHFFNPHSKGYQTATATIPSFQVDPPAWTNQPAIYHGRKSSTSILKTIFLICGMAGLLISGLYFRNYLLRVSRWILAQFDIKIYNKRPKKLQLLDEMIGQKQGIVLKNYLLEKGLNKAKIIELLMLKKRNENQTLVNIFQKSDNLQKDYLIRLTEELLKEEET